MKTRLTVSILVSSLVLPGSMAAVLPASTVGLSLLSPPAAFAQGSDAITDVARQRYNDGVAFYDAGRYEEARAAFLQAYALKRHPAVLLNLGQSELRSNHSVDAGNHLQQFLREFNEATPDQRAAAQRGIEEAKKRAPHVIVIVDADGADVSLDGSAIGKSPIVDPVFVEPGKHTLVASFGGQSTTTTVDAKVGPAIAANLVLGVTGTTVPPGGPAQPPPMSDQPPPPPTGPGFTFGGPAGPQPDQPARHREPLLDWYTSKPLAWVGTGVAGVGLTMGIIFSITATSASSAAEQHAAEIEAEAERDGIDRPCGAEDGDADDVPKYRGACNTLRDDLSDHDTSVAVATVGWVLLGVGVVGTVTYAMIDWFPGEEVQPGTAGGPRVQGVVPVVSPTYQGMGVVGSF